VCLGHSKTPAVQIPAISNRAVEIESRTPSLEFPNHRTDIKTAPSLSSPENRTAQRLPSDNLKPFASDKSQILAVATTHGKSETTSVRSSPPTKHFEK
jgi:hypothetical protein